MSSPSARLHLSIRQQLIVGVALVQAVLMTIFVVDLVVRQRSFLHEEQVQRSGSLIQGIARQVTVGLLAGDVAAVQEAIDGLREYPELHYAFVTNPEGRVLAHSDIRRVGSYLSDSLSLDMLGGARQVRTLVDDEHTLDLATPVLSDKRLIGWVRFAAGRNAVERSLQGVAGKGALYALVAILAGAVLAYLMGGAMTSRLQDLLRVADRVRAGQRDVRASPDAFNEVGRMAAAFNAMLEVLVGRERSLQEANAVLEARVETRTGELAEREAALRSILEHANDAFIQMDQHGHVTSWNDMAQTTFGWRPAEAIGRTLAELIIPPAQREAHAQGLARYLSTGEARMLVDQRVEMTGCTRDGREIAVEVSLRVHRRGNSTFFDAFLRNITERRRLEHSLAAQAATDPLTGLPNRRSLLQTLPQAMRRVERTGRPLALIFLDLDGFKNVNDSYGHEAGDRVLVEFARRLRKAVRETDSVARLGGDEFVVILEGLVAAEDDAGKVAAKILLASEQPYELANGRRIPLSASVGLSLFSPTENISAEDLLARSDEAMYRSKHDGKARVSRWADL